LKSQERPLKDSIELKEGKNAAVLFGEQNCAIA